MAGDRIEMAKQALIYFLKSLPQNSLFNIISFGSAFTPLYPNSVKSSDQMLEKSISDVE